MQSAVLSRQSDIVDYNFAVEMPPAGMGRVVSCIRLEVDDTRICDLCADLNGKIFDINDPITNVELFHDGCRGSWGFITDEVDPEISKPDNVQIPDELLAEIMGINAYDMVNAGSFRAVAPAPAPVKMDIDEADDIMTIHIKSLEETARKNNLTKIFGIDMTLWNKLTYAEKREFIKNPKRR